MIDSLVRSVVDGSAKKDSTSDRLQLRLAETARAEHLVADGRRCFYEVMEETGIFFERELLEMMPNTLGVTIELFYLTELQHAELPGVAQLEPTELLEAAGPPPVFETTPMQL